MIKGFVRSISLIPMRLRVYRFRILEALKLVFNYYPRHILFGLIDIIIHIRSLFKNPYRELFNKTSKRLRHNINVYGETPISTMHRICNQCSISPIDVIYEVGSGLGRICFWLYFFTRCKKIIGIEQVDSFCALSNKLRGFFYLSERLSFIESNFMNISYKDATCIYFYGSSYAISIIKGFAKKLHNEINIQTKVITVSYSLAEFFVDKPMFYTEKSFKAKFPWGETTVFLNKKL